jgi:probable HAF family extracellular repeat protein
VRIAGVAALAALALATGGAAPRWTVTDIGVPPGQPRAFMTALAVNAHGVVLGSALIGPPGRQRSEAFTWRNGRFSTLRYRRSPWVDVAALNDNGAVVGDADGAPGGGVVWRNGRATALGTLGGRTTSPAALNDRGQVVGSSFTAGAQEHAFLWQNGSMTDLGTLGGATSQATAINDRGQVIGTSTTADGFTHAFLWQRGTMIDLGSLPGVDSYPTAIDDRGEIAGATTSHEAPGNPIDALLWRDGRLVNLGRFGAAGASAVAINAGGDVLVALDGRNGDPRAALLLRDGKRLRIQSLGGSAPPGQGPSLVALRLNDRDQVLGYGYTRPDNRRRSFIWQNGTTTLLPTFDGVDPPWGSPTALNDDGVAVGITYRSLGTGSTQHIALWRPSPP